MLNIYIANLGKYNEGELKGSWVSLPIDENSLNEVLKNEVGINEEYEEWAIHDYETNIKGLKISEYDNIYDLNELAEELDSLSDYDFKVLESILEWGYYNGNDAIREAIENINSFSLYSDINNDYDLGYYYAHEIGIYDLDKMGNLSNYIDYKSFGRDIRLESDGTMTNNGWIEYVG